MGVTVSLPLFGSPDRELEDRPTSKALRMLAENLHERLLKAAETLDTLRSGGWSANLGAYDLLLEHPRVHTQEQAEASLRDLGLDPEHFLIVEDVEDFED